MLVIIGNNFVLLVFVWYLLVKLAILASHGDYCNIIGDVGDYCDNQMHDGDVCIGRGD